MLTIPPEQVCYIIAKAREFDAQVEPDDPGSGSNPSDDRDVEILEATRDNPTYAELVAAISTLNVDEQNDLIALVWLGRGDFGAEEWAEARAQARERNRGGAARYLTGIPLLSDYLEEGCAMMGVDCEEFEIGRM